MACRRSAVRSRTGPPLAPRIFRTADKRQERGRVVSFYIPHHPWPLFPQGKRGIEPLIFHQLFEVDEKFLPGGAAEAADKPDQGTKEEWCSDIVDRDGLDEARAALDWV